MENNENEGTVLYYFGAENPEGLLKNGTIVLKPAPKESLEKLKEQGVVKFHAKKLFELEPEERAIKLRRYLLKDIFEQLIRRNYLMMIFTNDKVNKVFSADKTSMTEVEKDIDFKNLLVTLRIKNSIANLVASYSTLQSNNTKKLAENLISEISSTAQTKQNKFNSMPTIEEAAVLQIERILKKVDAIVDEVVAKSEANIVDFEKCTTAKSFFNVWYKDFNTGANLAQGHRYFGNAINSYTSDVTKDLQKYAQEYAKDEPKVSPDLVGPEL